MARSSIILRMLSCCLLGALSGCGGSDSVPPPPAEDTSTRTLAASPDATTGEEALMVQANAEPAAPSRESDYVEDPDTFAGWLELLNSPNARRRALAGAVLRSDDAEAYTLLVDEVYNGQPPRAETAARLVAESLPTIPYNSDRRVSQLLEGIESRSPEVRARIGRILRHSGGVGFQAVRGALSHLEFPDDLDRVLVLVRMLGTFDYPYAPDAYVFLSELDSAVGLTIREFHIRSMSEAESYFKYDDRISVSSVDSSGEIYGLFPSEAARKKWPTEYIQERAELRRLMEARFSSIEQDARDRWTQQSLVPQMEKLSEITDGLHNLIQGLSGAVSGQPSSKGSADTEAELLRLVEEGKLIAAESLIAFDPTARALAARFPINVLTMELHDRFNAAMNSNEESEDIEQPSSEIESEEDLYREIGEATANTVVQTLLQSIQKGGDLSSIQDDLEKALAPAAKINPGKDPNGYLDALKDSVPEPMEEHQELLLYNPDDEAPLFHALLDQWKRWQEKRDTAARRASEDALIEVSALLSDYCGMLLSLAAMPWGNEEQPAVAYGFSREAAIESIFEMILDTKGFSMEQITLRNWLLRSQNVPELGALIDAYNIARSDLTVAASEELAGGEIAEAKLVELAAASEQAELALARASSQFDALRMHAKVIPADVARALQEDELLVEYVKYRAYEFEADPRSGGWGDWQYAAYVASSFEDQWGETPFQLISLGAADEIDHAISTWLDTVHPNGETLADFGTVRDSGTRLSSLIWEPIARAVGAQNSIFIAPDSTLAFVPFEALPGKEGGYLVEEFQFTYLSSGRELVRKIALPQGKEYSIVGNPRYTMTEDGSVPEFFPDLAGASVEAAAVSDALEPHGNVRFLGQETALESSVKSLAAPAVLHLATHAFFLMEQPAATSGAQPERGVGGVTRPVIGWPLANSPNPMHRSGIALAGANEAFAGLAAPSANDGILTAEEVAALDLNGTWLVVISACQTGLGEVRDGEGVFGLRRAFAIAGARRMGLSLWTVSDDATRQIMESFYARYADGQPADYALTATKRAWLADHAETSPLRLPYFWAPFIIAGA